MKWIFFSSESRSKAVILRNWAIYLLPIGPFLSNINVSWTITVFCSPAKKRKIYIYRYIPSLRKWTNKEVISTTGFSILHSCNSILYSGEKAATKAGLSFVDKPRNQHISFMIFCFLYWGQGHGKAVYFGHAKCYVASDKPVCTWAV